MKTPSNIRQFRNILHNIDYICLVSLLEIITLLSQKENIYEFHRNVKADFESFTIVRHFWSKHPKLKCNSIAIECWFVEILIQRYMWNNSLQCYQFSGYFWQLVAKLANLNNFGQDCCGLIGFSYIIWQSPLYALIKH